MFWEKDTELSFRYVKLELCTICKSVEPKQDFQAVNVDQKVNCIYLVTEALVVQ